jgi:hypothetical protein
MGKGNDDGDSDGSDSKDNDTADSIGNELESYWDSVSDEELLATELTTDDPEALAGLVTVLPDGYEDSYVEYSYNLRGSGREEFVCVHGHHKRLCGFVMRKGDQRWLVGWICGESIYHERFDQHKADFNAAVNRRERLRKKRDVDELTRPLTQWLRDTYTSGVFEQYHEARCQLKDKLPWVWLHAREALDRRSMAAKLYGPQTFFSDSIDPKKSFEKILADMNVLNFELRIEDEITEERLVWFKQAMTRFVDRAEKIVRQLSELEDAFQPNVLEVVCDAANELDNPVKREYSFGLLSITCKRRQKADLTVEVPTGFTPPDMRCLDVIRKALEAR